MVFSSLVFLFIFLPVVLLIYFISPNKIKNTVLLISSLVFYAWGEPKYVIVMIISIIINYIFGWIVSYNNKSIQKIGIILCVICNISMLGIFKYSGFFIENMNNLIGMNMNIPYISLPLGISFFTFQAMSYVIDVYRKEANIQKNIFSLALYISLFPQLVAGPIVRYQTIENQINDRYVSIDGFSEGIRRFIIGAFKKVVIANSLGIVADSVFSSSIYDMSSLSSWIGIIAYSMQIFFDFSGYSDMAIGLGKMFGFEFLENFNYPYISTSVSEFWRRWHISLSTWFRDYVYIPLGGNRKDKYRTYINLMIVWLLTGFWHGASWTFMLWGIYFGIFICAERAFLNDKVLSKIHPILKHLYLLIIVCIGWVFFRADNFSYSLQFIRNMFIPYNGIFIDGSAMAYINDYWLIFAIGVIMSVPFEKLNFIKKLKVNGLYQEGLLENTHEIVLLMFMLFIVVYKLVNSTYNPFLYFRF